VTSCDNFWSAFCVFHARFWEKTHSYRLCALKTQWFSTTKKSSKLILCRCWCIFTVLLKSVNWLVTENVSLAKFKSMIEFMHDVGVPDIDTLKNTNYNYESQYASNELLGNQSCVKSCQKHCFLKTPNVFQKYPLFKTKQKHCFPLFWNEKFSLVTSNEDMSRRTNV